MKSLDVPYGHETGVEQLFDGSCLQDPAIRRDLGCQVIVPIWPNHSFWAVYGCKTPIVTC